MVALTIGMSSDIAQKVVDSSSDIIIALTHDFIVEIYNKAASRWLKVPASRAIGMPLYELFAMSSIEMPFLTRELKQDSESSVIKAIYDEAGNSYLCHWHVLPLQDIGGHASVMIRGVINTDLESIANNLMQIINCVPGSLYWKDKDGRYLGCNTVMLETAGFSTRDDIVGKTDFDLWPDNAKKIRENDLHVIETGETQALEEEVRIPDGNLMYFTGVKMPLRDENNEIIGIVGNSLDITKLKKTEAELLDAKRKAEESNQIKTEFINNMEHDIRTPFNGVWGFANILAEREIHPEKKEQLEAIANCAKELLNYCDGILDYSRIEHGNVPIMDKCFSVEKLVKSVMDIDMIAATQKGIDLTVFYDEALPRLVYGDSYRLKRILLNLVGNAIKFTNSGFVKVSIHVAKLEEKACVLKFCIEDSGIGIPEEKRGVIYERFSRGTPSNRGLYKGQGLGLRIVKQFVTELDGQINLKSETDVGSRFVVFLPFTLPLVDEGYDDE